MDGGVSYRLRAGLGAKPYIDIGVSWTIHSDREASLQMCWGGRPLSSLEQAIPAQLSRLQPDADTPLSVGANSYYYPATPETEPFRKGWG